ncbi:probable nicotianamine synthase 4 [Dendrobium catenatum]|uniref:Nicotianamine synthase n=1 Tax=Dendrobium catenatum TaxID=906689 RepID=A0A2I0VC41_9ASPA|nr:probable nicotianamine synthase 4 [Dendrobium catenatum]PKU60979.1 putative nicotianamine synthase 4 [Dendrobium catenatum]
MVIATKLHHHRLLLSQTQSTKDPKPQGGEEEEEKLITIITQLYNTISNLPSLHPSPQVNSIFSSLVSTCIPSYPSLSLSSLSPSTLSMRSHLISLCSSAESFLELHYSSILLQLSLTSSSLLPHLPVFPYFSNYLSLSLLESSLLFSHLLQPPPLIAFLGSGPLPLSSIILASRHFPSSTFHNFDIDPSATAKASALVANDNSLAARMEFITADASAIGDRLRSYGVVFLAALVGLEKEQKVGVIEHLSRHMAPGAMLVVRSAHGARMFLYPVVEPADLKGFEVLSVYHPDDEVINSVIVARKIGAAVDQSCKCREGKKMEEMGLEEIQSEA